MTTSHRAAELGPLFGWEKRPERPDGSGRSGPLETTGESSHPTRFGPDVPDGTGSIGPEIGNSSTILNGPERPEHPDFSSEKANDSPKSGADRFHPLRGEEHPDVSLAPSGSSAALSLRSQRTDRGGLGDSGGSGEIQKTNHRPTLRPYQTASIDGVEREWESGTRRTLLVLPTGCGKTVVFAELARRLVDRGRRVLVLAHRTELLEQAQRKLTDVGVLAGIEQADRRAGHAPVVVASVQTLRGPRLRRLRPSEFDVIIDEAHHATAASYRAILDHFADSNVLGVTATPDRADGTALGEIFASVAYRYELRQAIAEKFLAPIIARRIFLEGVDLSSVRTRAGDLAQDELAEILSTEEAVHGVVGPLLEQTIGKRTILFAVNVAHAHAIAEVINRHLPDAARAVDGSAPDDVRKRILRDYSAGRFQYLINCALFTEGFDEPGIQCVATARPTKSRALCMQMVGRGTRLSPGKTDCLWLDFTGNAGKHRLVGPVDALAAGEVPDDLRREAERLLTEEAGDIDDALEQAQQQLEERRRKAKVTASARYFATDVDPFFGDEIGEPILEAWAGEPATEEQRRQLLELGMKKLAVAPSCTRGEVVRILAAAERRRKLGLCSYKQGKLLQQRLGLDPREMTRGAAGARIQILADANWDLAIARPRLQKLAADELLRNAKETP